MPPARSALAPETRLFSTALQQGKVLPNPAEAVEVTPEADLVRRPLSADPIEKIFVAACQRSFAGS